jgi:hypothetical protein
VGRLLFLLPILGWGQAPPGSVHGYILDSAGRPINSVNVRLLSTLPAEAHTDARGSFRFDGVEPGWYILAAVAPGFRQLVTPIRIEAGADVYAEQLHLPIQPEPQPKSETRVLTVCEALEGRDSYNLQTVVIVGIFKSGMDETLRENCGFQLRTGEIAWPNSIALSNPAPPPDTLREAIEKKRQQVEAGYPPEAQPRSERIVGLYGKLASPEGLTSAPCCGGSVETTVAPARLFGPAERDPRAIQ